MADLKTTSEQLGQWGKNVLPGWKNRIGVLLSAIYPFMYLLGQAEWFDVDAIQGVLEASEPLIAALSAFGVALSRFGYLAKLEPEAEPEAPAE